MSYLFSKSHLYMLWVNLAFKVNIMLNLFTHIISRFHSAVPWIQYCLHRAIASTLLAIRPKHRSSPTRETWNPPGAGMADMQSRGEMLRKLRDDDSPVKWTSRPLWSRIRMQNGWINSLLVHHNWTRWFELTSMNRLLLPHCGRVLLQVPCSCCHGCFGLHSSQQT